MKRILTFLILLTSALLSHADTYTESFNEISDNYINFIQDAQIIRQINGGSVIIPIFDESCPEELKAPFSYACKIVEEYMPPCLPLKVKVNCGRLTGSSSKAISKIMFLSKENFGKNADFNYAPMSTIKGVILAELPYGSKVSYLDSVPDVEFLTQLPDIEITYNNQKLNDVSFSLEANPEQSYDFVSIAIRDLLKGLGISSNYRNNPVTGELLDPARELSPFECYINRTLGNFGNPAERLIQATKGELLLTYSNKSLKLYAPSPWQNGVSLNYFIPQEDCCVSNILSYDFCKGMVTRSLSDEYSQFIFRGLLGWKPNYLDDSKLPSASNAGSTSLLMPYNGSISFNNSTYGIATFVNTDSQKSSIKTLSEEQNNELDEYIDSFHPFLHTGFKDPTEGVSISVLKKDGSWDLVQFFGYPVEMKFNMSDWTFHFDENEYARTIDGHLRARLTTKLYDNTGRKIEYKSIYFVIDYLPQKVGLSYAYVNTPAARSASATTSGSTVRIYFSNTEGLNRIVLEALRPGGRVPSKTEISDLKKGYYETTISRTYTFTAVGYNDNGYSRSVPVTVSPVTAQSSATETSVNFRIENNYISLESTERPVSGFRYTITPIECSAVRSRQSGSATDKIDISDLSSGIYVLTVTDDTDGTSSSFKFRK